MSRRLVDTASSQNRVNEKSFSLMLFSLSIVFISGAATFFYFVPYLEPYLTHTPNYALNNYLKLAVALLIGIQCGFWVNYIGKRLIQKKI